MPDDQDPAVGEEDPPAGGDPAVSEKDPLVGEKDPGQQAHPPRRRFDPHLIEADEDRFTWRIAIRRDPRKLFFYRIGVGVAGAVLMVLAALTGPLPGPGGIPLFLLGLAIWASEFEWALAVLDWFKKQFNRYRGWSRKQRFLFWGVALVCGWAGLYVSMVINGIPLWLPEPAREWLDQVPGLTPFTG